MGEEIAELRAQLDEARATIEFQDYRRRSLSKMLKIGIWEWDEVAGRPLYYAEELAEIFDVEVKKQDDTVVQKGSWRLLFKSRPGGHE